MKWPKEKIKYAKANAHLGIDALTKALGIARSQVAAMLKNHKIRTGRDTRFVKGQNPWTAGKHIRMSPATEFKKGVDPLNTLPEGTITVRKDKSGATYQMIKVPPFYFGKHLSRWQYLSRYTWEQHHGPIPKKHVIIHKDKKIMNDAIENLECITMRENSQRNHNAKKMSQSMQEAWENGTFYLNDHYIATTLCQGNKELMAIMLQNKELIATKREQLLLNRKLNNKIYVTPY